MSVRMRPDGTFEFDTPREAVEFERLRAKRPIAASEAPKPAARPSRSDESESDVRVAKAFHVMAEGGSKGVPTDDLVPKLGLSNSRAMSGVAQAMRRRLETVANGTPVNKLLWTVGRPGKKRWFVDAARLKELRII